ncbi:methyltransferase domain-containing protein [Oscillatoria sp. CS-180]|uniref:methyltransferase domain-containing protein n=1 Tax=Oscillatoria sp. CS-180 TaxID=3021720 RepID=UPI002330706C|nr:methyltransferase domain-containing protein [Oscillatoria sp. CS-180]MDB9525483.1 methyltransferase domain-containing protein [Oscillatoria sp. CS-180]
MSQTSDQWEYVRPQFDALPYPNVPLEQPFGNHPNYLSVHSCVIPYYLRYHQVINTQDKWILDAGCGSGVKAAALAMANPGARVVGIDISPKSVELAKQRIEYHGIQNPVEFHCLAVEELPSLGYSFDYINCDETLYLLADPVDGLEAMRAVLKPDGIIRANMHSAFQRADCYRVQAFLTQLGYLRGALTQEEIALTRQTMRNLQDWTVTKREIWQPNPELETDEEKLFANFLLRGDKGTTMQAFSTMLQQAGLEFVSMVDWRTWNLEMLFKDLTDLPLAIALTMAEMSLEKQLHLFDLLHPVHRLLDLYCGHPGQAQARLPLIEWSDQQWKTARVHLHPQLKTSAFKKLLRSHANRPGMIPLDQYFQIDGRPFKLDSAYAGCLYALLETPKTVNELAQRWLQVNPLDPITLQPAPPSQGFATVRNFLANLEQVGYVLIELNSDI